MEAPALERHQVWVYLLAVGAGLLLGSVAPGLGGATQTLLWLALATLLYVTFVQVPVLHLRPELRDGRFAAAALVGNFVVLPLAVWLMVPALPEDPAIRIGVLLVLLVLCTDCFITFTQLAGGDAARAVAISPLTLLLQLLLVYLSVLAGADVIAAIGPAQAAPALAVVLVPLALAAVTQWWAGDSPTRQGRVAPARTGTRPAAGTGRPAHRHGPDGDGAGMLAYLWCVPRVVALKPGPRRGSDAGMRTG